jgi:hypothetical protein
VICADAALGPSEGQFSGPLRNAVEGASGIVKDGAHAALADSTHRRVRGTAPQSIFAALAFMATNILVIQSFLHTARPDPTGILRRSRPPRRKARPSKPGLLPCSPGAAHHRPNITTPSKPTPALP